MRTVPETESTRWDEITQIWNDNRWLFAVAGWLVGLLTMPFLQGIAGDYPRFLAEFMPHLMCIIVIIALLNRFNEIRAKRAEKLADEALKKRLVYEVRSHSNDTARDAIQWLHSEGWLTTRDKLHLLDGVNLSDAHLQEAHLSDASLEGAGLSGAHLQGAILPNANLRGVWALFANFDGANLEYGDLQGGDFRNASFRGANLQDAKMSAILSFADFKDADLSGANLENASLRYSNLQGARLDDANLQRAYLKYTEMQGMNLKNLNLRDARLNHTKLQGANLEGIDLQGADMQGAELQGANLCGANLRDARFIRRAKFDEKTVLPDAQPLTDDNGDVLKDDTGQIVYDKYWTPETMMLRYADPNHADFWQPVK